MIIWPKGVDKMTINNLQSISALGSTIQTTKNNPADALGRDQFMLLLLAQLRNQDPLSPMDDKEFITQLATFNTLDEMRKINENLLAMSYMDQFVQAGVLLGKTVTAIDPNYPGNFITGQVSGVSFEDGAANLIVDGIKIPVENVTFME